ncbi:2Fe-2S iron-sulfur cluster-binding protein [Leeuwenhoekiella sp. W20_SRS_FM14]|uniref:2Fe-2S iron-sulfur cluster-binding protein n=1 Tax=Leeuwenhoekiella sp. W20_SRS_FM14 TaxID=3240270 RepID=UPI003F9BBD46
MSDFHALTIQDITRETAQAVSITFGVPDALKNDFRFKAGQYVTLKTKIDGKEVRRAYSLCSTPQSGLLKIAVKEVEGGTFSVLANNKLTVGESLEVHPPEGKFFVEPNGENSKDYAAFAAGSGITPVLSIIKTVLEEEPKSRFVLLYGNRTVEETIFHKELLELQLQYPERLFIEFVYSRKQETDSHFGRIEKATVNFVLKNKFKSHNFDQYFLCGPEEMIKGVSAVLAENSIPEDKIKFELFTSSSDGEEIAEALDGITQLKIVVDDEEFELTINQDKVVLDAALENDIDVPYSCQGGICSSCIARVTEGTAVMRKNQILTDGEVAEGLILTCQALATSANLTVDYDDL